MKKFIISILFILLFAGVGSAQFGQGGGIAGITFDGEGIVFGSPADSVIFEIPVSIEATLTITTLASISLISGDADGDSVISKASGFNITNSAVAGILMFQVKDSEGSLNAFSVDSLGNVIMAGDVSVGDDVLLADGSIVGITGNEVITFLAAGSINFTGATVDIDGAFTATSVTADAGLIGTSLFPAVTNVGTIGDVTTIWNTGTSGTWTLGDDSDNVSGQLNFISLDGDLVNISIATTDVLNFNDALAYGFDARISVLAASQALVKITLDDNTAEADQLVGKFSFHSNDTNNSDAELANISGYIQTTITGAGNTDGYLVFNTAIADVLTEKMRIDKDGNVTIGVAGSSELTPTFSIIHDADSDAPDTDETLAFSLTQNSDPTLSIHTVTNTNNLGIDFDMPLIASTLTSDGAIGGGAITGSAEANFTNNAAAVTFGAVGTDADVVLAFDAVTAQGSITYMEDEDRFDFDNDLDVIADLTAGTIISDGVLTALGAFTSIGIDDNADAVAITIDVTTEKVNFAADADVVSALTAGTIVSDGLITANGAFTSPGIDDNADATAITIDVTTEKVNFSASIEVSGIVIRSVTAGITASNPGNQGDSPLTTDTNEISVVGAGSDGVTLPAAPAAGSMEIFIINNGANILEIWPASGDNLGAGVDTATTLAVGANITFSNYDGTNWEVK